MALPFALTTLSEISMQISDVVEHLAELNERLDRAFQTIADDAGVPVETVHAAYRQE